MYAAKFSTRPVLSPKYFAKSNLFRAGFQSFRAAQLTAHPNGINFPNLWHSRFDTGYFCLVSPKKMTAQEAYRLYRGRDVSEKLFRADKSFLGSSAQRIHSNEAFHATIFVEFVELIIRNRFFNLLKDQMERLKTRSNTMTVPGAIRELDKIEMTRRNGGRYLLDHALTKNQKTIFQSFDLSAEKVFEEATTLTQKLLEARDEKVREDEDAQTEIDCVD